MQRQLEKEYKRAVDSVSEGEVSGLIEGDYGFYVIELIEPDAKEHASAFISSCDKLST